MTRFFLTAKAWQLFLIIILPTLLSFYFQYLYLGWINELQEYAEVGGNNLELFDFDFEAFRTTFYGVVLLYIASYAANYGWYRAVSLGLEQHVPPEVPRKEKRFRLAWGVAIAGLLISLLSTIFLYEWAAERAPAFFAAVRNDDMDSLGSPDDFLPAFFLIWGVFMLVGIALMIASIYTVYYTGKTIKVIEVQKDVRGSAVAGYAILAYFLVIGIWVLQPKVNRLVSTGTMSEEIKPW